MSFIEMNYTITGWKNEKYVFTAKQLCERVLEDSKSNYNWIAPATELVRVIQDEDFPEVYAQKIKIAILNCFANIEIQKGYYSKRKTTDVEAVYFCYNSLEKLDKKTITAKENYLKAIIKAIVKWKDSEERLPIHPGVTYRNLSNKWIEEKFAEYASIENIDFYKLKADLRNDFDRTIEKAEAEGAFEEDDKKWKEELEHRIDKLFSKV